MKCYFGQESRLWPPEGIKIDQQNSIHQCEPEVLYFPEVYIMSTLNNQHESRAERALIAVLPRSVEVAGGGRGDRFDLVVNGQPLEIKWMGEGRLGDVRRLLAHADLLPEVVVARRLSPGARSELSDAGVGWVDESGAAEIAFGTIVVSRSGVADPDVRPAKRWTPSVLAVAEAALCGVAATSSAMHAATGLSTGSCVNGLRVLTDLGLLQASVARGRDSARRVIDQGQLLDSYASVAPGLVSDLRLEVGVTWRDLADGLRSAVQLWESDGLRYAVTGAVAAEALAPYLTTVSTAEVFVSADTIVGLQAAASAAGLKPVEGGRLVLRPFPTVSADRLATVVQELRVAPWPRVYVDLLHSGVRGEDAAEHLREVLGER